MKGLVISWYFPPINSSEGICTFKLLKNSKFQYDVYTQKNNKNWSYDTNETKLTSSNINPIYSDSSDIETWVRDGIDYCKNNIDKYDFIMSRSMAPESHEIALEVKRQKPNVFWIASFGDPITNSPYIKLIEKNNPHKIKGTGIFSHSVKHILNPKRILKSMLWEYRDKNYKKNYTRYYKDEKLQDDVLKEADIIIFNNNYQRDYMLEGYNDEIKNKSLVLPHGYDLSFYGKKERKKDDKFIISYLGHLDDIRTPDNFLKALRRIKDNKPELYNKLEINIYGEMAPKDKIALIDLDLVDVVKFKNPIKYFESLNVMQNSDLLLLIDANLGKVTPNNIYYAAKLADYVGSKSNIFGITMYDGPSADIIREVGGVISSHSIDEIYFKLVMILENKIDIKCNDDNKYNIRYISNILDQKINELNGRRDN